MSPLWAAEIPREHLRELAQLRLLPGIEMAESATHVWLRGDLPMAEARLAMQTVPHVRLYHIDPGGLRLWGELLVSRPLPTASETPDGFEPLLTRFAPLRETLPVELPQTVYPHADIVPLPVRLVRDGHPHPASFLEITRDQLAELAESAPKVRLDRWAFAVSADGRVLVRGQPLPSCPGSLYWENDGNLIPVGWTSEPAVDGETLSQSLGRRDDEYLLLHPDGTLEGIPKFSFVQASRAAIRNTMGSAQP